jgi:hypothetical protein
VRNEGIFIVTAEVGEADRVAFDDWYEDEHLSDALTAFGAKRAWRAWSTIEPSVHYAYYVFSSVEAAASVLSSDALKTLVDKFDKAWSGRVKRSRDVVEVKQYIG